MFFCDFTLAIMYIVDLNIYRCCTVGYQIKTIEFTESEVTGWISTFPSVQFITAFFTLKVCHDFQEPRRVCAAVWAEEDQTKSIDVCVLQCGQQPRASTCVCCSVGSNLEPLEVCVAVWEAT